jgi:hypothetical protein
MRKTKHGLAVIVAAGAVASSAAPRIVAAQTVETLPRDNSGIARSPFHNAAPDMKSAKRLAGCYTVNRGPWSHAIAEGTEGPVPSRIDLMLDAHQRIYIGFRLVARTPGFAAQRDSFPAAWGPVGRDSVQLRVWADGKSSVVLFLQRQPDEELRGTARYFSDSRAVDSTTGRWMWETYPRATVSLRRTACDSNRG